MISKMAMEDIEALRADGIDVPPREVIRLNALGLRVERSAHGDGFSVLPRVAWLGDLCFREPTIGDEMWLGMASRIFNAADTETLLLLRAVSLSTKAEDMPPATDKKAVLKLVGDFQRGPASGYTAAQLFAALSYAISGADPEHGEEPPPSPGGETAEDADEPTDSADVPPFVAGVIMDGLALKLGTIEELARLRPSQLRALVLYTLAAKNGDGVYKGEHGRALGAYFRALDALRGLASPVAERVPEEAKINAVQGIDGEIDDCGGDEDKRNDAEGKLGDGNPIGGIISGAERHDGGSIAHG